MLSKHGRDVLPYLGKPNGATRMESILKLMRSTNTRAKRLTVKGLGTEPSLRLSECTRSSGSRGEQHDVIQTTRLKLFDPAAVQRLLITKSTSSGISAHVLHSFTDQGCLGGAVWEDVARVGQ